MARCSGHLDLGAPYAIAAAASPLAREEILGFSGRESGLMTDDG
jgi:hypothetical protein